MITSGGSSMVFGFVAGLTPLSTVVKAMVVGSFPRRAKNAMIRGEGATSNLCIPVLFLLFISPWVEVKMCVWWIYLSALGKLPIRSRVRVVARVELPNLDLVTVLLIILSKVVYSSTNDPDLSFLLSHSHNPFLIEHLQDACRNHSYGRKRHRRRCRLYSKSLC